MLISELIIEAAEEYGDYDSDGVDDDAKYSRMKIGDWIKAYNSAQRALLILRPDVNYKITEWQLTVNEVKQSVPADCLRLISIDWNMGSDGLTKGARIRPQDVDLLADMNNDWNSDTGETEIEFYGYELQKPDHFMVFPRPHATTAVYVQGAYSYAFTDAASGTITSTNVAAEGLFTDPLRTWMLKRAYDRDTDSIYHIRLAQKYEQSFYNQLGIEFSSAAKISGEEA